MPGSSHALASPGASASPRTPRCGSCGSPADRDGGCCAACGATLGGTAASAVSRLESTQPLTAGFGCQSCGAQVLCEPGYRSYECAFCGSTYVVELPGQAEARLSPKFVVPFRVDRKQGTAPVSKWKVIFTLLLPALLFLLMLLGSILKSLFE